MEKIKILHIQETLGAGGVERRRYSLARCLSKERFEQKIICTQVKHSLYEKIENEGVEVLPVGLLKGPFDVKIHLEVQKIIDSYQPDIIHGAVFEGNIMASFNGFIKNVPIIIAEETSYPDNRSWRGNLLLKLICYLADQVVGVSPATVKYLTRHSLAPKRKIKLINNGVALPRVVSSEEKFKLRKSLGIEEGEIVIGTAGRMLSDENKRFSDLIKSLSLLRKKFNKVKLLLLGEGDEMDNYMNLAKDLNVEENVIFVGFQEDISLYYSIMNIFSLVSSREGFGLVLAEAMLNKLPVVASNVGGMKYVVEQDKTGYLVERYNVNEITEKLEKLIKDEELRLRFGEAGYKRAMENYTEDIYVKNVENLYLELAKKKGLI